MWERYCRGVSAIVYCLSFDVSLTDICMRISTHMHIFLCQVLVLDHKFHVVDVFFFPVYLSVSA